MSKMIGFKTFNIGRVWIYNDEEITDTDFTVSGGINQEQTEASMIKKDVIVAPYPRIKIHFTYPLDTPAVFEYESEDIKGFTRLEFYRAIQDGYNRIYNAEEDPGTVGNGCINRNHSTGPYGIWGHYISDLFIEGVKQVASAEYKLLMGS